LDLVPRERSREIFACPFHVETDLVESLVVGGRRPSSEYFVGSITHNQNPKPFLILSDLGYNSVTAYFSTLFLGLTLEIVSYLARSLPFSSTALSSYSRHLRNSRLDGSYIRSCALTF